MSDRAELVFDWATAGPRRFETPATVAVQDETLRDGLQSPTASDPTPEQKLRLLHLMDRLGVDSASLGLPAAGSRQAADVERLCREIAQARLAVRPNCGGRTLVSDVRPILDIRQRVGIDVEACLFIGSSPIRRFVEGWDLEQMLRQIRESIGLATAEGLQVLFITEDTTRTPPEDLGLLLDAAIEAGATRVCLCDTVGAATPEGASNLVQWTRRRLGERRVSAGIDWHGHRDRGLGTANALAALSAGASRIHATALGLGERVGNTPMEQLLVNLKLYGLRDDDLTALPEYVSTAAQAIGASIAPDAPIVGRNAFRTATGVHASAVLKARNKGDDWLADRVYSSVPASWVGRDQRIEIGPLSGASNVEAVVSRHGLPVDRDVVEAVLRAAKRSRGILDEARVLEIARRTKRAADAEPATGNYFVSAYPPFSCWGAEGARSYAVKLEEGGADTATALGVYVHIPFCSRRCDFCYYLSHDDRHDQVLPYLGALLGEACRLAERPALASRKPDFVYVGGGTPSMLNREGVTRLLKGLAGAFPFDAAREVSFECAPRSVTGDKLEALRDGGVTRISLGVQQLDDAVLASSGRVHAVRDVLAAYERIRAVGFDVVNVDLIVGMVGETEASFATSLERVIGLEPESITIYQLEVPHNTPLYRAARDGNGKARLASWETKRARLARGFERLEAAGYILRSGYTAVRDSARHAFVYQDQQYRGADIVGIGASAFSYLQGVHHQNRASLDGYMEAARAGTLPLWRGYSLSSEERVVRELILQLKLGGADARYFRSRYGIDIGARFGEALRPLVERGEAEVGPEGVSLTRDGLLRVDRLLPQLYLAEHRGLRYS